MEPTPNFTEIYRAINNGHYTMFSQRMADMLGVFFVVLLITFIVLIFVAWLIYRNKKAIKKFIK